MSANEYSKFSEVKLVDLYGESDQKEKQGAKEKRAIKDVIISKGYDAEGTHDGVVFTLGITVAPKTTLDNEKVIRKIGKDRFIKAATVSVEALKQYMSLEEIDTCIDTITEVKRFTAKKK